jgi:hypothetical protein
LSRFLLINASHPSYNLGLEKAARYLRRLGHDVKRASEMTTLFDFDAVWISAIFSEHVPKLLDCAEFLDVLVTK